ncbi:MAG TPA: patatin-like phospholipase family protein [Microthrixaceae bacterium]|nr:patatin-like phospholipase family protein [Microthrixaceae bacterium]
MTTAFVLSGGGSLGAVQVGMLRALSARGIHPDVLIGTSVGALNAAYVAGNGDSLESLNQLAAIWLKLRRRDVFPLLPHRLLAAAAGLSESLCSENSLRRLIASHIKFDRLEDAQISLHVVATDVASGKEILLSEGNAVDAILASSAIPAVFPSIQVDGLDLVDGGIADNAAISQAIDMGADTIYVLPTGYACALEAPPRTALASAVHALTLMIEQRLILDVARYSEDADIRVVPPLCPLSVSSSDFSQAHRLFIDARASTARWLVSSEVQSKHPDRVLSLHSHQTLMGAIDAHTHPHSGAVPISSD